MLRQIGFYIKRRRKPEKVRLKSYSGVGGVATAWSHPRRRGDFGLGCRDDLSWVSKTLDLAKVLEGVLLTVWGWITRSCFMHDIMLSIPDSCPLRTRDPKYSPTYTLPNTPGGLTFTGCVNH